MSRLSIHLDRSPIFRVRGLPVGSAAAEALIASVRGQLLAFQRQQRQQADIAQLPIYYSHRDLGDGLIVTYHRQYGTEVFVLDARAIPVRVEELPPRVKIVSRTVVSEFIEDTCTQQGGTPYNYTDTISGAVLVVRLFNWAGVSTEKRNFKFYWDHAEVYGYDFLDLDYTVGSTDPPPGNLVYEGGVTMAEANLTYTPLVLDAGSNLVTLGPHEVGWSVLPATTGALFWLVVTAYIKWDYAGIIGAGVYSNLDAFGEVGTDDPATGDGMPWEANPVFAYTRDARRIRTHTVTTTYLDIYSDGRRQFTTRVTQSTVEELEPGTGPNPEIPPDAAWGPCGGDPEE